MIMRSSLAAGLAALAVLFVASEAPAKPAGRVAAPGRGIGGGPGGGPRVIGGGHAIGGPRVVHPTIAKTVITTKAVVTTTGLAKSLPMKPAFIKAPQSLGGKTVKTVLYAKSFGIK